MERLRTCQAILPIPRHSNTKPKAFYAGLSNNSIERIITHSYFLSRRILLSILVWFNFL